MALLDLADRVKRGEISGGLEKKIMAMVFMDPSLRTRASFEEQTNARVWNTLVKDDPANLTDLTDLTCCPRRSPAPQRASPAAQPAQPAQQARNDHGSVIVCP